MAYEMGDLDYRITGLPAARIYGASVVSNAIDIAVESDEAVHETVRRLKLPQKPVFKTYDPYVCYLNNNKVYVRIQGDILGEPYVFKTLKLHSKELLLKRLDIYSKQDARVLDALAFVALTLDKEKTEKYKNYWNRL
jgi:hypothetical protein